MSVPRQPSRKVPAGHRLALDAKADALEVSQLEGELLDFDLFELSLCLVHSALSRLFHHVTSLGQQGWVKVQSGKFGKQIHGLDYTTDILLAPC